MRIWRWETQMISCEKTSLTDNQFHKYLVGRLGWAGDPASLTELPGKTIGRVWPLPHPQDSGKQSSCSDDVAVL